MNVQLSGLRVGCNVASKRRGRYNNAMQRVDAGYLYELGDAVRCAYNLRLKTVPAYEVWGPLNRTRQKLNEFLTVSVYSKSLRGLIIQSRLFLEEIDKLIARIAHENLDSVRAADLLPLSNAYDRFEPAFANEISNLVIYLVQPKGAYDVIRLVESGHELFPQSVGVKVPEAVRDLNEGAKCLAYELWTAAALHFHRANEAVLRRYFDHVVGKGQRKDKDSMGILLGKLKQLDKGKPQITVALENIKCFHRNPVAHPGHFVENSEEAISLVAAIRAAMSYMLDELPGFSLPELAEQVMSDFALEAPEYQQVGPA